LYSVFANVRYLSNPQRYFGYFIVHRQFHILVSDDALNRVLMVLMGHVEATAKKAYRIVHHVKAWSQLQVEKK
jgi:hypothetical protein